jgi:hypothetical protein
MLEDYNGLGKKEIRMLFRNLVHRMKKIYKNKYSDALKKTNLNLSSNKNEYNVVCSGCYGDGCGGCNDRGFIKIVFKNGERII